MTEPTPDLCDGCTRAVTRTAQLHAEGRATARAVHYCYRTNYGQPCGCVDCHPVGSFKVAGSAEIQTDLEVDLAALIRDDLDTYRATTLAGHEEWERPMVFLWAFLEDDAGTMTFGWRVNETRSEFEFSETASWSEERFEQLCAACPEARIVEEAEAR